MAAIQGNFVSAQTSIPPTPTIDRLAKPTLPAEPDVADIGAQDYWLYCSPCHGDKAQGLTDDFRMQYPIEDQYCWDRGCHGEMPYRNGWTIPMIVPALVGPGTLRGFPDALSLKVYMQLKMPFQTPGILEEEIYWRLTGFVLKQNGYWDGKGELNDDIARRIVINPLIAVVSSATPTFTPTATAFVSPTKDVQPTSEIEPHVPASKLDQTGKVRLAAAAIGLIILIGSIFAAIWVKNKT